MLLFTLRRVPRALGGKPAVPHGLSHHFLSSCPGDSHCWATDFRKRSPFGLDRPALVPWPLLTSASSHGHLQSGKPCKKPCWATPALTAPRGGGGEEPEVTHLPTFSDIPRHGPWMARPCRARVLAMLHKGHSRDTPPCVPSLGYVHQTHGLLYPLKQRVPTSPP